MVLRKSYYQLSKEESSSYLSELKSNPLSIILYQDDTLCYFFYPEEGIHQRLLSLHQLQWELDSLFSSFSKPGKKQLIKSFLMNDILSTNAIEEIHSASRDVFSILSSIKQSEDKGLLSIAKAYSSLLENKDLELNTLSDFRSLYDEVILPSIRKEDYPDGQLFRKNPVYVSNGIKAIHNGFYPEDKIEKGLSSLIDVIHQDGDSYLKAILSHFLLEAIHPFYDGNGRFGRYLFSAMLKKDTGSVVSFLISSCIQKEKGEYYSALKEGEERLEFGCLNTYVEKMIAILSDGIASKIKELNERKSRLESFRYDSNLSKAENKIRFLLLESTLLSAYGITNSELMEEADVSKRTLMYFLKKLKSEDRLIDTKFGRFTYHKIRID